MSASFALQSIFIFLSNIESIPEAFWVVEECLVAGFGIVRRDFALKNEDERADVL